MIAPPLPHPAARPWPWAALWLVACTPDTGGSGVVATGSTSTSAASSEGSEAPPSDSTGDPLPGPRKRRIDLDPALVDGVGGTTLLVVLDEQRIEYAHTRPGGADLRFFDPDEASAFPVEIERWDPEGRSFAWVRIDLPTLPDHLWMYYGDDEGFAAIDPAQVWDGAFAAVWHMTLGEGARVHDSTAGAHHLEPVGFTGDFEATGLVGTATYFEVPAQPTDSGPLELPDAAQLELPDGFTLEAWVWSAVATTPSTVQVLRKAGAYELHALEPMVTRPRLVLRTADGSGPHELEAQGSLVEHEWTYLAATYQAADGTLALYRDGELQASLVVEADPRARTVTSSSAVVQLGRALEGMLDEVRVSTIARSAAWIRLQHASMSDALMTFGPPEPR
jgi:hypothetical protein